MQIRTMGCDRLWCGDGRIGRSIVLYYNGFGRKDREVPSTERTKRHAVHLVTWQLTGNQGSRIKIKVKEKSLSLRHLAEPIQFLWRSTDRSQVTSLDHIPGSGWDLLQSNANLPPPCEVPSRKHILSPGSMVVSTERPEGNREGRFRKELQYLCVQRVLKIFPTGPV